MKKIITHISLITIGASLLCTALATSAFANIPEQKPGECYFVEQLKDPIARMEFVTRLELAKQTPDTLTGIPSRGGEQFMVQIVDQKGHPAEVDQFSYDCMACHDGMSASAHNIRVTNTRIGQSGGITSIVGSHPIGMDYGSCAAGNQSFKDAEGLVFVAGRVGCLSCHNPLNP